MSVTKFAGGAARVSAETPPAAEPDWVAVEEPLELRVQGQAWAVLLRSPGQERELLAGFLASEGVIRGREDLSAIEPCRDPTTGQPESHIWNAALAEGVGHDPARRRWLPVGSACGLCGARTIAELARELPAPLPRRVDRLAADYFARADRALREAQATHRQTAGCHGAGLFHPDGRAWSIAEDVGRHNAVDKVLGRLLLEDRYPAEEPLILQVSGRISFEIVQKAALAGLCAVVGAGAPTSLAVEAAHAAGLSLFGLARPDRANRYAGDLDWAEAGARPTGA